MNWEVILPIAAGTACFVVIGVAIANSGSGSGSGNVSSTNNATYEGDSEYYQGGRRKRTRRRKHRK